MQREPGVAITEQRPLSGILPVLPTIVVFADGIGRHVRGRGSRGIESFGSIKIGVARRLHALLQATGPDGSKTLDRTTSGGTLVRLTQDFPRAREQLEHRQFIQ
jgi:hypothetical protein